MAGKAQKPICHVVAGPNGSGKSTFALNYLPEFARSIVNMHRYAGLADILRVFDASGQKQELIYTRHDKANPYSPRKAARMRKELGI